MLSVKQDGIKCRFLLVFGMNQPGIEIRSAVLANISPIRPNVTDNKTFEKRRGNSQIIKYVAIKNPLTEINGSMSL